MKERIVLKSFDELSLAEFQEEVKGWDRQQRGFPSEDSSATATRTGRDEARPVPRKSSGWRSH